MNWRSDVAMFVACELAERRADAADQRIAVGGGEPLEVVGAAVEFVLAGLDSGGGLEGGPGLGEAGELFLDPVRELPGNFDYGSGQRWRLTTPKARKRFFSSRKAVR